MDAIRTINSYKERFVIKLIEELTSNSTQKLQI